MIYLRVAWLSGEDDEDLFRFQTLQECIDYMKKESITEEFIISSEKFGYPEEDYTLIEKDSKD